VAIRVFFSFHYEDDFSGESQKSKVTESQNLNANLPLDLRKTPGNHLSSQEAMEKLRNGSEIRLHRTFMQWFVIGTREHTHYCHTALIMISLRS